MLGQMRMQQHEDDLLHMKLEVAAADESLQRMVSMRMGTIPCMHACQLMQGEPSGSSLVAVGQEESWLCSSSSHASNATCSSRESLFSPAGTTVCTSPEVFRSISELLSSVHPALA